MKQKTNRFIFKSSFARKMMMAFLVVALLPIISSIILLYRDYKSMQVSRIKTMEQLAQEVLDGIDRKMEKADFLIDYSIMEEDFEGILRKIECSKPEQIHYYIDVRRKLITLRNLSGLDGDLFFYLPSDGILITTNHISINKDDSMLYLSKQYDGFDWNSLFYMDNDAYSQANTKMMQSEIEESNTLILIKREVSIFKKESIYAVLYLPIENLLDVSDKNNEYEFSIIKGDTVLASTGELNMQNPISVTVDDHITGFSLRLRASMTTLMNAENLAFTESVIFIVSIIMMVIITCIFLSSLYSKPMDRIMSELYGEDYTISQIKTRWNNVSIAVKQLITEHAAIKQEVESQAISYRHNLLFGLITSAGETQDAYLGMLSHMGLDIEGIFSLLIFELSTDADVDVLSCSLVFSSVVEKHLHPFDFFQINSDVFCLLLKGSYVFEDLKASFDDICDEMNSFASVKIKGACTHFIGLDNISEAYIDVYQVLENTVNYELKAVTERTMRSDISHIYSPQIAYDISQAIQQCDPGALKSIFQTIIDGVKMGSVSLSSKELRALENLIYIDIGNVLSHMKTIETYDLESALIRMRMQLKSPSIIEYTSGIESIVVPLIVSSNAVKAKSSSATSQLASKILNYIDSYYWLKDMSLSLLSQEFQLSETYISQTLLEYTNKGFFKYCEEKRIESAKALLLSGENVEVVAEAVGYSSAQTFRRAFKKNVGITPSAFENANDATK